MAAILALYTAIALPLALFLNVWIDEYYSFFNTDRDLAFVIRHCREFMNAPSAFFVLLWSWRGINDSVWFARLLPFLLVGLSLVLAHFASRKWFPRLGSHWFVLPLAVNPWIIFAAIEVRVYCLVVLCSVLLLYSFHDGFLLDRRRRWQCLYGLSAILALKTFYYTGFILAGGALALALTRQWRALRDYLVIMVVVALACLPQFIQVNGDAQNLAGEIKNHPGLFRAFVYALARTTAMELDFFFVQGPWRAAAFALAAGVLVFAAVFGWRRWTVRETAVLSFVAAVVAGYTVLTWRVAGEESFFRHFMVALLPIHFAVVGLLQLTDAQGTQRFRAGLAVLAIIGLAISAVRFAPMAKLGDYRRVAHYVEAHEEPGDVIAIAISHAEYPFLYYYRGPNKTLPIPKHDPLDRFDFREWTLTSTDHVRAIFAGIPVGQRMWVYTDRAPEAMFHGVDLGLYRMEQVLKEDFTPLSEQDFFHAKVRLFRRVAMPAAAADGK